MKTLFIIYEGKSVSSRRPYLLGHECVILKTLFMRAGVCHPEDLIYEGRSVSS